MPPTLFFFLRVSLAIKSFFPPLSKLLGPSASNLSSLLGHLLPPDFQILHSWCHAGLPQSREHPLGFLLNSEERSSPS